MRWTLALALIALTPPRPAAAADDDSSLFVQPHTGAFLRLEEDDKRGVGRFAQLTPTGVRLDIMLSAPLDTETRESSLANLSGVTSGFAARAAVGYDSRKPSLSLTPLEQAIELYYAGCVAVEGLQKARNGCTADGGAIVEWYLRTRDDPWRDLDCELSLPAGATSQDQKDAQELGADCRAAEAYLNTGSAKCDAEQRICVGMQGLVRELERRTSEREEAAVELERYVVPTAADGSPVYFSALVEGAYSLDRVSFYDPNDIAAAALTRSSYAIEAGPRFDFYVAPAWAFSFRAGLERSRDIATRAARRCVTITSTDPTVSGESCSDVRVLKGNAESETSAYVRTAAMYLARHLLKDSVPGVEARAGFESLGQQSELDLRVTAFISPVTGPVLTRFGIGVDFFVPLKADEDGNDAWALRDISPFLVVGLSL